MSKTVIAALLGLALVAGCGVDGPPTPPPPRDKPAPAVTRAAAVADPAPLRPASGI